MEEKYESQEEVKEDPESLQKFKLLSSLISRLQSRLSPVLRPDNELKNVAGTTSPPQSKSDLMYGFEELEIKLQTILNRLHL